MILRCLSFNINKLFRYGGLYLDLDVFSITSLKDIKEESFACNHKRSLSDVRSLNGAIMKINGESGHKFIEDCLK